VAVKHAPRLKNLHPGEKHSRFFLDNRTHTQTAQRQHAAAPLRRVPGDAHSLVPRSLCIARRPTSLRLLTCSRLVLNSDETKAQVVVPVLGRVLVATGATHVPGVVVPAPAANGPRLD